MVCYGRPAPVCYLLSLIFFTPGYSVKRTHLDAYTAAFAVIVIKVVSFTIRYRYGCVLAKWRAQYALLAFVLDPYGSLRPPLARLRKAARARFIYLTSGSQVLSGYLFIYIRCFHIFNIIF